MESLVERAGTGGGIPTVQRLWNPDRHPEPAPTEDQVGAAHRPLTRVLNFVIALCGLVLLLPLLLVIGLLVWLSSPGPVLYT
ncbi:MAG TPA: hypothetical protein VIM84_03315, partial [Gemmatimonadales bacterium]